MEKKADKNDENAPLPRGTCCIHPSFSHEFEHLFPVYKITRRSRIVVDEWMTKTEHNETGYIALVASCVISSGPVLAGQHNIMHWLRQIARNNTHVGLAMVQQKGMDFYSKKAWMVWRWDVFWHMHSSHPWYWIGTKRATRVNCDERVPNLFCDACTHLNIF